MTTKEKCTDKCCSSKCCNGSACVVGVTCFLALVASVFAILAFVAVKKIAPVDLWPIQTAIGNMYAFTVNQNGGEASFQKLSEFYASAEIQGTISSQIDAMIAQQAGTEGDTPAAGNPSATLSRETMDGILSNVHYFGDSNAKILLLEYSEFLCSFCKRHYSEQTLEQVVANHQGEVALIFKGYPIFGQNLGAQGLYCAGKLGGTESYYAYVAEGMKASEFTDDLVLGIAKTIGLKENDMKNCMNSTEAVEAVNADKAEGQNLFNINGTPGNVVLNRETGEYIIIGGAYPVSEFESAVTQLS